MTFISKTARTFVVASGVALTGALAVTTSSIAISTAVQAQGASQIVVQGNRRIDSETVRSYFRAQPGRGLDAAAIDEGVKALYATGLFRDVRVSRVGGRLVVNVAENQVINRVAFEGNRRIRTDQLTGEVESRARGTFSRATVQSDVQRIYDIYRRTGRYDVTVEPKTIEQPNGRVDLVFEINEGRKASIRAINFVGNRAFGNQRLRDQMTTGTTGILSWIRNNDVYDADRLNADQEALRRFYLRNGYADFRVVSARADFDQAANAFTVTIEVDEGEQYRFGRVDIDSNIRDVDGAQLRSALRTTPGSVYNVELIDKSLEDITVQVARRGYAFAQVRPRGERDSANRTVNIVYVVEEGPRVYVERINVRGNTRTQDRVVRREFDVAEGDAYNRVLVDRAERRLNNLGFFKTVRITTEPGSAPDRVIVNVDVEDQATGAFSVSGGYSTMDGFIAEVSVEERNFLGRGQFVRVGGTMGQRTQGLNFSFTEPYFLDYRLSAGFDLFWRNTRRSTFQSFDSTSYGGTIRFGIPITEQIALQLRYSASTQRIRLRDELVNCLSVAATGTAANPLSRFTRPDGSTIDLNPGDPRAAGVTPGGAGVTNGDPGLPLYNVGGLASTSATGSSGNWTCVDDGESSVALRAINNQWRITSMLGYSLIYNTLDRFNNPTSGIYAELRQDFAGLGGNSRFVRTTGEFRYFHDLTGDVIGSIRLQAGNIIGLGRTRAPGEIGGSLAVVDQFFMGPELVRGFATAGIGPRDFNNHFGGSFADAVGGTNYWGASAEMTFPIALLPRDFGMRGAIFADAGAVWGYNSTRSLVTSGTTAINVNTVCTPSAIAACAGQDSTGHYLRASVGVGLLWSSPFGPIRFDYSFPLAKAPWDRVQQFRFSGGTRF